MRVRLSRPQLLGLGALAVLVVASLVVVAAAFGPMARARVAAEAARRRVVVKVGGVRPGWFAVRFTDVALRPEGTSTIGAHFDELRVGLGLTLRVDRIRVRGGDIVLTGSPEAIRDDWIRWRGEREGAVEGASASKVSLDASGVSVHWSEGPTARERGADARGIDVQRDGRGTRLTMAGGRARLGAETIEWTDAYAEQDATGVLVRAHATSLTVGWAAGLDPGRSQVAAPTSEPLPPPVIARSPRSSRRPRLPPDAPSDAGAPLISLPDLHAIRARAAVVASLVAARIRQGSEFGVDSLTWKIGENSERVALTIGPGPLSFVRSPSQLELDYSTRADTSSTPLALRIVVPTEGGDVVITAQGGPVSLSLLGVQEQAAGLVDVDKATLSGRARVVLAGDGNELTFDAEGGAHGLSLNQSRVALDTVRGLDVGIRARGALTAPGDLRLDDFSATLGSLRVAGSGTLQQKPDRVVAAARLEIPVGACQSLLDSIPSALLPVLQGTKMAGTFGARAHFAFDTRSLDQLELKYDIADRCRLVEVPAALDRERFLRPFAHRIYLPDGSVTEETTGPGTPDWTPLEQISPYMQTAVLTTEDGAFPKHHGYNHAAIRASIIANLKARRFVRGASTITMQLAKNLFLSRDKTLSRKLEEVVLTDYIEETFSKEEIMELYLNVIEFGPSVYGIASAAEYYFGRAPAELSLGECLFLSSILPAPLRYGTMRDGDQPSEGWLRMLHTLMEVAHKRGLLTDAELSEGESEPILFWHGGPHPPPRAPARAHAPADGSDGDIPDPFEPIPEGQ